MRIIQRVSTKVRESDTILLFVEKRLIKCLMSLLLFVLVILKVLNMFHTTNITFVNDANHFVSEIMTNNFIDRDSTLITLAAVFIGIYFTAFTLLATLSSKSAISILDKDKFNALLVYCKNAFIASFSYLIISLISPALVSFGWYYSTLCLLLLTYMLLSASRFGWLIYLILRRDVDSFLEKIKDDELESIRINRIINELEIFLKDEKEKKSIDKANEISEMLSKRQQK